MQPTALRTCAISFIPALATMLVVQACGGGDNANAQDKPDEIVGVWEAVVTVRDCTSNAALATFRGQQVMHHGGTLTDAGAGAPSSRGPGFGIWSKNADGTYAAKFRFYRFNTDGTLAGHDVVSTTRTLSADRNGYTSTTRAESRDVAGAVLATRCVTDVGTRFQ